MLRGQRMPMQFLCAIFSRALIASIKHRQGGTLDLVVTKSEQVLTELTVDPPCIISDHSVISWRFPLSIEPRIVINREVRAWSKVNQDSFRAALLESELCSVDHHAATEIGRAHV